MSSSNWNELKNLIDEIGAHVEEGMNEFEKDSNSWWDNLSYDDRLKAFFVVTKKIYEGDLKQRRSYRGMLYEIFNFEPDAYIIGMKSGYLDVHNSILTPDDLKSIEENAVRKYIESHTEQGDKENGKQEL